MKLKDLLIILLVISLFGNLVFFLSDGITYFRMNHYEKKNKEVFQMITNIEEFRSQVRSVNLRVLITGNRPEAPHIPDNIYDRICSNLGIIKNTYPRFYWSEPNWLFLASLEDAIKHHDAQTIDALESLFSKHILNTKIVHTDQGMSGYAAIVLYKYTSKPEYKEYAERMAQWCIDNDTEAGILYNGNMAVQIVDGYGMYLPFLNKYAKVFNDSIILQLATKHIELAAKYIMDPISGIPAHGYTIAEPHVKCGSCNLGRGVSWFSMGLLELNDTLLTEEARNAINRFNDTLVLLWKNKGYYSSYLGDEGPIELTTTLPLIYYMYKKGLVSISKKDILDYSKYSDKGLLYHCRNSVINHNNLTASFGPNILAQAFILKLLNEVE